MPDPLRLTARQARRMALAAQGLAKARPAGPHGGRRLRGLVRELGVVQIDSVNVLTRTHYLPAFSRLGPYDREALEQEAWGPRPQLFEYWGHEASLLPHELHPLFRWRMARARAGETWAGLARFGRERRDYIEAVLKRIDREGPVTGGDFAEAPRVAGWWTWSDGKTALEWLFWAGLITTKTRRGFERVYDLTDRVLPRAILALPTPEEAEAHRGLIMIAARALGVATEADLRDYFRMPVAETRARIAELAEEGALIPASVEGWKQPAWTPAGAVIPRRAEASALLSPFDNLIWCRDRTERLFGARIRLEIYTPAHKRAHGYYVLPFLQADAITARVDLKADRAAGLLRVQAAHLEAGADASLVAPALSAELGVMAAWLGLKGLAIAAAGDLAPSLLEADPI